MKLNYLGDLDIIKNKLDKFEKKINNSEINILFNDPINIEFFSTFDNISELNSDESVNIKLIKQDIAFCSTKRKKIYVKKDSLDLDDDEFDFMLSHEVAHIFINKTNFRISFKYMDIPMSITDNNNFKEELADYLSCKWGFRCGFIINRLEFKGQKYIDCFDEDETEFAEKIYKYKLGHK